MSNSKVIGTIQVAIGGETVSNIESVEIISPDGSVRTAGYGEFVYEGEQIISNDTSTLFQIKYLALAEPVVYEGVFTVLADGSVIAESDNEIDINNLETAAGEDGTEAASAYIPDETTADQLLSQVIDRGKNNIYGEGIVDFGTPTGAPVSSSATLDDTPPTIISANVVVYDENSTDTVLQISSSDENVVTYKIEAGLDSALFIINATTGAVSFIDSPNYEAPQDLGADNEYNINVTATDALGNFTTQAVSININNINEAPVSLDDGASTTENAEITIDVLANDTDVDNPDTMTLDSVSVPASQGTVTVVNNQAVFTPGDDFNYLNNGEDTIVTLTYIMSDTGGLTSTSSIEVTVVGADDGTVVTDTSDEATKLTIDEDAATVTGSVAATDVDTTDSDLSYTVTAGTETLGSLAVDADGAWTYTIDDTAGANALNNTETVVENFTITISTNNASDGVVETITQGVQVTVVGTNDQPIVTDVTVSQSENPQNADIDAPTILVGSFIASDVDSNDTTFRYEVENVSYDAAYQATQVTYIDSDGAIGSVFINVKLPTDVGMNDISFTTLQVLDGAFTLTGDFNALSSDDTLKIQFKYTADDGHGFDGSTLDEASISDMGLVTLDVTGTNDGAVVTGVATQNISEDNTLGVSGSLNVTDLDANEAEFVASADVSIDSGSALGTLSIDAQGNYTYVLDAAQSVAINALDVSDVVTETYTVSTLDGTTEIITINIHGAEDATTISVEADDSRTGSVTEDPNDVNNEAIDLITSGTLTITDADHDEDAFSTTVAFDAALSDGAQLGGLSIDADGAWTYTVANDDTRVQELGATESIKQVFEVSSIDGTESELITITINGTDDAPVVTGNFTGDLVEGNVGDADVTATGTIAISDVDANDNPVFTDVTKIGDYGTLVLDNGAWTYTLDQASVQTLHLTDPAVTDTITLVATDGTTQDIVVTIAGTEDTPTVEAALAGTLSEDDAIFVVDLLEGASDADGDTLSVTAGSFTQGDSSGITVNNDNTLTVNPSAYNSLPEGQNELITYSYTIVDGHGESVAQTAAITIEGQNDAATIGDVGIAGSVTEDVNGVDNESITLSTGGTLVISDPDTGEAEFVAHTDTTQVGTFDLHTDGAWTFTVDNTLTAIQELKSTDHIEQDYEVVSADGTATQTVTVTINGTNDVPTVTAASASTDEASSGTLTIFDSLVNLSGADDDANTTLSYSLVTDSITITPVVGNAIFDAADVIVVIDSVSGRYQVRGDFEDLSAGDSLDVTFQYTADDGEATSTPALVTLTVNGTNDKPVVENITITNYSETNLTDPLSQVDDGTLVDAMFSSTIELTSENDLNNTYTFSIDHLLTPAITNGSLINGTTNYVVDMSQTVINIDSVTGAYTITNPTFNNLAVDETVTIQFGYTVNDGADEDYGRISFSVKGTNDQPILTNITQQPVGTLIEENGTATLTTGGVIDFYDLDTNDTVTVEHTYNNDIAWKASDGTVAGTLTQSQIGELTADFSVATLNDTGTGFIGNGTWTYSTDTNLDFLANGETITLSYDVNVDDGKEDSDSQDVIITVTGTNDAPVITNGDDVVGLTETDVALTTSGAITVTDVDTTDVVTATVESVVVSGTNSSDVTLPTNAVLEAMLTVTPATILDGTATSAELTWNFNSDTTTFDYLATGETLVLTYTIQATDDDGSPLNDTTTVEITVTGTNDAPTLTATDISASEDTLETGISAVSGTLLAGADDVDTNDIVTINQVNGINAGTGVTVTLAYNNAAGVAQTQDVTLTVQEDGSYTISQYDLDDLPEGNDATVDFTYSVKDNHSGVSTTETATITITGTNDAPVMSSVGAAVTYTENAAGQVLDATISLSDADDLNLVSATVVISGGGEATDVLSLDSAYLANNITTTYVAGTLAIIGNATLAEYEDMLEHVTFHSTSENPDESLRTITWTINDGHLTDGVSIAQTSTVTVIAVNDAPVIDSVSVTNSTIVENSAQAAGATLLTVNASDVDNDLSDLDGAGTHAYSITNGNNLGYFQVDASGNVSLTTLGHNEIVASHVNDATFNLTVTVNDGEYTDSTNVTITVDDNGVSATTSNLAALTTDNTPSFDITSIDSDALKIEVIANDGLTILAQASRASVDDTFAILNTVDGKLTYDSGTDTFTYTQLTVLVDGSYNFNVKVTDDAGNPDNTNTTINTVVIDTTADVSADLSVSITDTLVGDAEKAAVAYTVTGLDSDANAELTFTDTANNTVVVSNVTANGNVNLSSLIDGTITLSVTVADTAGNTATGTGDTTVLDTIAPTAPTIDLITANVVQEMTLSGTAEAGSTVTINGTLLATAPTVVTANDGTWIYSNLSIVVDHNYTFTATTTDLAGNISSPSADSIVHVNVDAGAGGIVHGFNGMDVVYMRDGVNGQIQGEAGNDIIYGGNGKNNIKGEAGNDEIHGGAGNDTLKGNNGTDILYGDSGKDKLYGQDGDDTLHGGNGIDKLYGGTGSDELHGDAGNDKLYGGTGADKLYGGDGNDVLTGQTGNDELYGGAGNDNLYYDAFDKIDGGADTDKLTISKNTTFDLSNVNNITNIESINLINNATIEDSRGAGSSGINFQDVINMTDSDTLIIHDNNDGAQQVSIDTTVGQFDTIIHNGDGTDSYTATDSGTTYTIIIDDTIFVD